MNDSSETICVLHRNNLTVPIRRTMDNRYSHGEFTVRSSWIFQGANTIADVRKSIQTTLIKNKSKSVDLGIIDKKIREIMDRNAYAPRITVVIDRVFTVRAIREMGCIYLHDEDIVLSVDDKSHQILHPFSSEGTVDPEQHEFISKNHVTGFFVELVDNEKNSSSRFMFTG